MAVREESLAANRCLVVVDGRLDQMQNSELETSLNGLLAAGQTQLIVDLTDTHYINSGGLRCLVAAWRKARQQDGDLFICGLNPRLKEVFTMVGFDQVFNIFPTYIEAQKAF
jgi:anti-anti-sigma factor